MIVYFANRRLEVLGMASTNLERSYIIKDDLQTEEVSSGISTLDLTVGWDMNDQKTLQEWMEVGNTVLMPQDEGSDEAKLYSIVQETIDTGSKSIEIYCEDAGLDFINEVAPAYSAGEAHEAQYYINKYLGDSGYEIGQNDMSTSASKKLSWDGESTVAERIQSIANSFGCEVSYTYQVHGMDVTHKYINLLSKRGDQETEPQIRLNIEADKITASKSIEDLATAFIVTGGTPKDSKDNKPITLIGYSYDDGNYYVDKTTGRVCSKQGMQAWTRLSSKYYNVPSGDATSGQIVKTYSYDTTDKATLVSHAVAELKKVDHPSATYEVEIPKLPEGVWIGDRVSIVDDAGELYVSARILGLEVSRTKQSVKITVGDYITRNAGISDQVEDLANQWSNSVAAMAEIAKQAAAAQSTADAANTAASKAQSTADSANTAAGNAQSTADSANTAASKAQSTANTASAKADNAAKVATNYVTDITGGGISVHQAGSTADAVKIDGDSVDIVHGGKTVASYGDTTTLGVKQTGYSRVDITPTEFNMVDQNGRQHVHFETPAADESSSTITYYMSDDYEREMGTANMSGLYYGAQRSGETQSFSTTLPDVVSGVKRAAAYVQGSSSSFPITDDDAQDVYYTYSSNSHTLSVYVTPAAPSSYPVINDFAFLLTLNTVLYSARFGAYGERGRSKGIVFSVANGTPQHGSDAFTVDYTGNVTAKSYNGHTIGSDVPAGVSLAYLTGTYKGNCFSGGYITGSAMSYRWEIPLERPVVGTITECTCEFTIRSGGKTHYTDKTVTFKPGTTGSHLVQEPGGIRILWSASTAVSGATNNSAIGVDCSYTFKVE